MKGRKTSDLGTKRPSLMMKLLNMQHIYILSPAILYTKFRSTSPETETMDSDFMHLFAAIPNLEWGFVRAVALDI